MKQLAFLLLLLLIGPSQANIHGGSSACPQGSAFADGCAGANANGSVQYKNFFSLRALQSGQSYTTRPPWNVAGVDYAVGIPAASIGSLKDPTVNTLPTGCSLNAGTHVVTCSGANGGLTIDGWDFGNAGGAGLCVRLNISGNVNGHIIVQNSNFKNSTGNGAQCNVNGGELLNIVTNAVATDVLIQNNVFDANAQNVTYAPMNPSASTIMSNGQNVTVQYNAFLHSTARAVQTTTCGIVIEQFNYAEGFTYTPSQALHGEFDEGGAYQGCTVTSRSQSYNTILQGTDAVGLATTALIYTSSGSNSMVNPTTVSNGGSGYAVNDTITLAGGTLASGGAAAVVTVQTVSGGVIQTATLTVGGAYATTPSMPMSQASTSGSGTGATFTVVPNNSVWTTYNVDHNTLVSNRIGTSNPVSELAEAAYNTYTTLNWTSNYLDPNGAFGCFAHASSPTIGTENFSGNIDLQDGSTVSAVGACFGHN